MAKEKGCTTAQLALAWVLSRGDDVTAIPGSKRIAHVEENAAAASLTLDAAGLQRLEAAVPRDAVRGQRHWDMASIGR